MRRGITFLLIIALLTGAFAALGEGAAVQEPSESGTGFQIIPFGERFTLETEVTADGYPRYDAGEEPFETLSFTLKIDVHKGPEHFQSEYATSYRLRGDEAVVQFEIKLNADNSEPDVIPQKALEIGFVDEALENIDPGYQLMDAEIAGMAEVATSPNFTTLMYKRYDYDPADPMRYLLVVAHVNGEEIPYLFDIGPAYGWCLAYGSEGEEVSRLQDALIRRGILRGSPDGAFSPYTDEGVRIVQAEYGMEPNGIVDRALLERICYDAFVESRVWQSTAERNPGIDPSALEGITKLDLSNCGICGIDELKMFPNLTELDLSGNYINDIEALRGLTKLTKLNLGGNRISDISALRELENLTSLDLSDNRISDIGELDWLVHLTSLDLSGNRITDISALGRLAKLEQLNLRGNFVSDIGALSGLVNLTDLNLADNNLSDIKALSWLMSLRKLDLSGNLIDKIGPLRDLINLEELNLQNNLVREIGGLYMLVNLRKLSVDRNCITKVSVLSEMTKLEELHLDYEQISDTTILDGLPVMQ